MVLIAVLQWQNFHNIRYVCLGSTAEVAISYYASWLQQSPAVEIQFALTTVRNLVEFKKNLFFE